MALQNSLRKLHLIPFHTATSAFFSVVSFSLPWMCVSSYWRVMQQHIAYNTREEARPCISTSANLNFSKWFLAIKILTDRAKLLINDKLEKQWHNLAVVFDFDQSYCCCCLVIQKRQLCSLPTAIFQIFNLHFIWKRTSP